MKLQDRFLNQIVPQIISTIFLNSHWHVFLQFNCFNFLFFHFSLYFPISLGNINITSILSSSYYLDLNSFSSQSRALILEVLAQLAFSQVKGKLDEQSVSCREGHISCSIGVPFHITKGDVITMSGQIYPLGYTPKYR